MRNKLPEGWKEVELGELFELKYGSSLQAEKRISGEFSVYGSNGIVGYHNEGITKGKTIIVGRKGSVGKINLSEKSCFPIDTTYYIDETKKPCDLKWLYYILKTLNLESLNRAAAVPGLNRKDVYSIKIPLRPLPVQKKIVSILEKAESLKQKREEADKKMKEYLQSVFVEMFYNKGFEVVELGNVCEINPKKAEIENVSEETSVSFVPMAIVQEHNISFKPEETKKISEVYTGYTYFKDGDVLLAKVTPCFENGKSGIARKLKNGIGFGSSEYHVLRNSNKLLPELIYFFISSNSFINSGKKQLTGTGGLRRLPKDYIEHFKIPLPPLPLQQKFAKIVEKVEKLKEKQKQSKEKIDNLFNSLMQKAFKGELT